MTVFSEVHNQAIELRQKGESYREISKKLNIARSTLNGWLKDIVLSDEQKERLHNQWLAGFAKARLNGTQVQKQRRAERAIENSKQVAEYVAGLDINENMLKIFLAGLYLGDGFKIRGRLGLGNADPKIVLLFVTLIRQLYPIDESRLCCAIFCRADQDPDLLINYWSSLLNIPISQFHKTQIDRRTTAKPSYEGYHGVCAVNYCDGSMQSNILTIGQEMIKYVNKPNMGL
ncbi:MAG: helix-turn-helix domain-containing protein [bacterium]